MTRGRQEILTALLLTMISTLALSASQASDDHASQCNLQGINAYRSGRLEEAVELYREALRDLDTSGGSRELRATIESNLSLALEKLGKGEEAKAAENAAQKLEFDSSTATQTTQPESKSSSSSPTSKPGPESPSATPSSKPGPKPPSGTRTTRFQSKLNSATQASGSFPSPQQTSDSYSVRNPTPEGGEVYALLSEGATLMKQKHMQEALDRFKRAVELAPNSFEAHFDLGVAEATVGQPASGIKELEQAVRMRPGSKDGWLMLAELYEATGQIANTISANREFIRRFPDDSRVPDIRSWIKVCETETTPVPWGHGSPNGRTGGAQPAAEDYYAEMTRAGVRRWQSSRMPLRVYIQSGQGIEGYRSEYDSILSKCFDDWFAASLGKVRFSIVSNPEDADILCTWTARMSSLRDPLEAGEARTDYKGTTITKCTIILTTGAERSGGSYSDAEMRALCLHEIGHALGMRVHTTNPDDVMFFAIPPFTHDRTELSSRDRNTIIRLYSTDLPED